MSADEFSALYDSGLDAMKRGDTMLALLQFTNAARIAQPPRLQSCLGYCLARERRLFAKALSMCHSAQQQEPQKSLHYLNLGRVYLLAGDRKRAISALRQGLKMERNPEIMEELKGLGVRKEPPFRSLSRNHPFNRHLGLLLHRLHLR